jgi:hypothetical protein
MNAVTANLKQNYPQTPTNFGMETLLRWRLVGISIGFALLPGLIAGITIISRQNDYANAQTSTAPEIAELIEVKGTVKIRRQSSVPLQKSEWVQVKLGDKIQRGDLLRVERNAKAVIRCTAYQSITWIVPNDGIPWSATSVCSPPANTRY